MDILASLLPWIQVVVSVLLVTAVLMQQSGAGLGGAFGGGGDDGGVAYAKRGAEKILFHATIVLGILFALSSILILFV